ncbi:hypothetical protein DL93DRAFT_2080982 [Clavulina sp. PMI_390]|nr:hypothetical protein DL93DRAFT_2080982 [Clavulina sp. PMI_390]
MIADINPEDLPVSQTLKTIAKRVLDYHDDTPQVHIGNYPEYVPTRKLAAVLVLLFERDGVVRVLLTTRSKQLRSHPGQVALPGGKSDPEDGTPFATALREANEEVFLPSPCPAVHVLRTLPPFISLYKLIVTPVVAILSEISILDSLKPNPDEVADIFDHPLEAFLDPEMMLSDPNLSPTGSENWFYEEELHNYTDHAFITGEYRNNRLRSVSTPIKGLTSSVMIQLAMVAYDRPPSYEHLAPKAASRTAVIETILGEYQRIHKAEGEAGEDRPRVQPFRNPTRSPTFADMLLGPGHARNLSGDGGGATSGTSTPLQMEMTRGGTPLPGA